MEVKKMAKIVGGVVLFAVVGILCVGVYVPRYQTFVELGKQRDWLSESNTVMEASIKEFKDMQVMFETDPRYVILTARRENYVHPREIVFIFPKE